jgi:hypothetical protein
MPDEVAEQNAAMIRAGLWALFASASVMRSDGHDAHAVTDGSAAEADLMLIAFNARFPIEEMLAE